MNKDCCMSYQYRRVSMKGGIDTVIKRSGPGYTRQLQCLSYKEPKEEEQKNRGYSGWFPHLQGHLGRITILVPQAGYTIAGATAATRTTVSITNCLAIDWFSSVHSPCVHYILHNMHWQ